MVFVRVYTSLPPPAAATTSPPGGGSQEVLVLQTRRTGEKQWSVPHGEIGAEQPEKVVLKELRDWTGIVPMDNSIEKVETFYVRAEPKVDHIIHLYSLRVIPSIEIKKREEIEHRWSTLRMFENDFALEREILLHDL